LCWAIQPPKSIRKRCKPISLSEREVRARLDFIGRERGEERAPGGKRKRAAFKAINVDVTTINGERKWEKGRGETVGRLRGGRRAGEARDAESTARRTQGAWRVLAAASREEESGGGRREGGPSGARLAVRGRGVKMGGG
jgi:hypothetical protein